MESVRSGTCIDLSLEQRLEYCSTMLYILLYIYFILCLFCVFLLSLFVVIALVPKIKKKCVTQIILQEGSVQCICVTFVKVIHACFVCTVFISKGSIFVYTGNKICPPQKPACKSTQHAHNLPAYTHYSGSMQCFEQLAKRTHTKEINTKKTFNQTLHI